MQVGGPIDNIIIDSYKFIGREPTQEEIDELKNKYQGDTEKAMNDFYSVLKTYTNETPDLRKKVALKSYYKVPLNFAETMALSENTSLNPAEENRTTKAKGYFQIIERWHKDDIQNIYGKDFQTAMQDPSIQEDYMYKHLVPSYEKRVPDLKKLFNQGYEKGVLDEYKPFMIGGRFTDDQLKAIQHVLGPTGAANLLTTGQTVDEGQRIDLERALSKMISLRKQYGVPTSLSSQYDFDKFGIGDILPYDILAAGEDKVEETPAPKTVPYQQAPLAPGRTKADLISPFLPKQEPKAEEEPKPKPKPIKERYGYSWEQGQTVAPKTIEPPKPASYAITETPVTKRENLIKSEGVKKQEFVESTAALKELEERNTYENYKEKPIDFENLTPEVIQARDEIQQVVANQNRRLSSSEALLRIQFGDTVTRDIQDVLANNANYTKTINNLEEKLKGKYGNNTPAKIDFGPLAEQNNEISENIKYIGTQINGIDSQLEGIQKKLDELDSDPNITPARYNVLNANLVLEYNGLIGQKNELIEKGKILEKDLEGIVAQQNAIINDYNKRAKAEFASDPDVQELNRTYEKYKQNWDKINNYKKSPYFDSYLDSISTLSELDPIYKNLFPDKMRGEQRSKQLAKLAQDIVTEKKTDSYLLNEALIGFYDIYNGVKSLFTDAPAVGYTSIGMNALKGATFNLVGDILASAATISDFAGAEKLGRELRAGDLFGFTVTGAGIEQDVARGAVRSDIAGNPVENYYTVKENDTQLFGIGLTPGDKIIVEDGSPILYRDQNDFKINLFTLPGKNPTLIVKDFLKGKENQIKEDLSIARTVVSALPSAVDMISLIGFNAAAIPRLSKFIASKGLRTAAGMTLNFGAQTFQQYGDLYKSYLDEGKSAQKAAKFALGQSAGVALIELLNPLEMKVASIGGDAAVSQFRKVLDTTVDLYSRGQIGLLDTINAIATGFVATTGAEISKETITELFQGAFENQVQNYASNENKSYTLNEAENTAWTTVAITTIPSFFLGAASYRTAKADIITSAIYNATKDPAKFEADTLKALKDGKMDIPDSASIFNFVGYIKEELDTYENLTDEQGAALSGLIGTRYSLENKKKNSNNEVVKKKIDEQIQEINTTIEEVAKGNKKVEVDSFVKPFYEEEGDQPEADRVPTKKEFSDVVYATMPKEWQDMSKEEAWKSFQELPVQDQIKFFNTATGKKEEVAAPSTTAAGLTKEQQTELDKVNKRAERIQRTLQEDTEVQEEGDEPLLTAEQKKKLETELQTLNQRRDAIQKQSTAEVPVQPGAEGRQGVGGQVQAKPEVTTGEGEVETEVAEERKVTNVSIEPPIDEDGEIDYEAEEAVRQIAKDRGLGITRDREIAFVARDEDGNIVGGAFTSYDNATGEYTFDVVVSEDYDGTGIGSKLLDSVINLPSDIKDVNPKAKVKVDVVNPRMKNMLEQRGFKVTKKIGDDRFIMEPSKKAPQATKKAAEPTPTPTTTEKAAPEAAKAPQKANTVQGFEITRKDGSKLPASDYVKDKKTGKWKRVAADGTTKGVSFAPYVKQLEDALSSPAAAETKKTEPTPAKVPNALKDVQSTTKALSKISNLGNALTKIKTFSIDGLKEFFHASPTKRTGRLKKNNATQFGIAVYFSTNKDLVTSEFGDNVTNVALSLTNPVFTNTKQWNEVQKRAIELADEDYGKRKNLTLGEDETFFKYDPEDSSEVAEIPSRFISDAAIELGYDAIVDKQGGFQYENEIAVLDESKIIYEEDLPSFVSESYHKAKKDGSNPALVKAVEDLLGVAPSPTAAETQATEAQTATAETVLEPIGKTSAEREKQIEKFFTAAAGKDKAESSQMAKLTNNIWNSVAKFFGARNAQTANQWIQSKVALIGKTTTTEAGKLGTPRFQAPGKINWERSPEGKGDPSISSRNPIVQQAAKDLKEGKITNEEYRAVSSENSPIRPITRFFEPATEKEIFNALSEDKKDKTNIPIENGTEVALRLDIPAYKNKNTWVVSVHDGTIVNGKIMSYTNVARITNASFNSSSLAALNIAAGIKEKNPIGKIFGIWENIEGNTLEERGDNAKKLIEEIANSPGWVQVGMNPFRHSYFYDRSNDIGRPVMSADEVIQVGGLVYAKNPVYGDWTDESFAVKDLFDAAGKQVQFQGDTDNPYTFAEAAEAVANNLITEIDRMIKERSNLANIKKRGFTKSQAAAQVRDLRKIKEDLLQAKKDPKWQVDAYHGTPYVFDKFSTEKIGTGEGAQAFGWGLYFTDLESIAKQYAVTLSAKNKYSFEGIDNLDNVSTHPMTKPFIKDMLKSNPSNRKEAIEWVNNNSRGKSEKVLSELMSFAKLLNVDNSVNRNLYKTSIFKGKEPGDYTFLEWYKPVDEAILNKIGKAVEGLDLMTTTAFGNLKQIVQRKNVKGLDLYGAISFEFKGDKNASLFLLRAGIDGIKYPAESISRGATADTARGFNYVIFDENDVTIEERVQFQQDAAKFRAAVITTAQNKLIVAALESPNASSFVHEGFHMFEGDLTAAEKQTIIDSYNDSFGEKETEFTTDVSEWGARMWEKYFSNGRQLTAAEVKDTKKRKALQEIFDNFTEWLKGVYEGVINYTNTKGVTKEVNIAPEVQALFDNIMGITTTPTPIAAETQVEAEAKTAEELSADIEADIEAAEAKEKMQTKNPTQIAGQELVNNPESAAGIPEDIAADLLDYVQGLKINIGGFKKIC